MPFLEFALVFIAAAVLTAAAIVFLLQTALAWKIVDHPNDRSMHQRPTPRIGGICLVSVAFLCTVAIDARETWSILALAVLICTISLLDDIYTLPVGPRFATHLVASAALLFLYSITPIALLALIFVAIVWMTNLYNFMDGLDGLSGGMTFIGFGTFAVVANQAGEFSIALLALTMAGAAVGFLIFNIPPARVFMGDAGAVTLGFLAAALGYLGALRSAWPGWFPILVFSPFIFDATWTVFLRLLSREKVWRAHRSHCYQRLARSKFGHTRTLLGWYVTMIVACATAYFFRNSDRNVIAILLLGWLAVYTACGLWINRTCPLDAAP